MDSKYFGKLSVIGMKGSEEFLGKVDDYIHEWRGDQDETYLVKADCPRFGTGEGKAVLHESVRGYDIYVVVDVFNYGVTYKMYGMNVPMSPDDHFADLKRVISACIMSERLQNRMLLMVGLNNQLSRFIPAACAPQKLIESLQGLFICPKILHS